MFKPAAAVFVALITISLSISVTTCASGQQVRPQEFPEMPALPAFPEDLGAIMQMHMTTGSNRSISMTIENGVKKINASEDGLKAYIEEEPEGPILIKVTRRYTSADLDSLMDTEPELYMHLKSIPEKTDTAEVEVSVNVTRTYEADSAEELESDHPDVFDVYQRFTSGNTADLRRLEGMGRIRFPEMPAIPLQRGIQLEIQPAPDGIRIFPQPQQDAEDDADESSDEDKDT